MSETHGHVTTEDGIRLFVRRVGNHPRTLIILNGFYLFDDFKYLAEDRTVISLDLRSRGRSDYLTDSSRLKRGVLNDVDDIEAVRRYFDIDQVDLLAHSYAAKTVILYAMKYGSRAGRIVQIGAMQPDESKQYEAHLTGADKTLQEFFDKLEQLQGERARLESKEFCKKFWSLLRVIYVFDPSNADKIRWDHCDLPTELNLMPYWLRHLLPSLRKISPTTEELAQVAASVLVVHGTKDRSSPFGGARDWAIALPNARLLAVENVAHAPWIEKPEGVFGPIKTFLGGHWPEEARTVDSL